MAGGSEANGAGLNVLAYQALDLGMGIAGHLHQVTGDGAFVSLSQAPTGMLHQGFLYPAIASPLVVSQGKGNGLCAVEELPDGPRVVSCSKRMIVSIFGS